MALAIVVSSALLNINTGNNWDKVPAYFLILFLNYLAAAGVGDFISIFFQNIELANQLFPLLVVPQMLTAGFMARVRDMVFYLQGVSYLSMMKFCFQALIIVQYDDAFLKDLSDNCMIRPSGCSEHSCAVLSKGSPACDPFVTLDFYERTLWENIIWLLGLIVFFRLLAIIIVNWIAMDVKVPYN